VIVSPYRPGRAAIAARLRRQIVRLACLHWFALAWPAWLHAQSVAEVQVTPETMTLGVGQRQTLFATAYDRQGNLIPNARFTFWSSDTLVAKVGKDGAVLGMSPGLAKVEARVQGLQASTAILITGTAQSADTGVSPQSVVLTLEPGTASLLPGESLKIEPRATREDGSPVLPGRIRWKSLMSEIASVDTNGVVIGVMPGKTIIQATASMGAMATTSLEVAQAQLSLSKSRIVLGPSESDTLRVFVPTQGNRQVWSGIRWRTSDSSVARVGPTGIITALAPGRAEISVAGFGQEGRAAILIHREPGSLVVTPRPTAGPIQLPLGAIRKVTAVVEAADSTPIPEARVSWEVGDTAVAGYDVRKGELIGRALGATTLTARVYGFDPVVWTVQVIPGTLAFERGRLGIGLGQRDSMRPLLLDQAGKPIGPASELKWASEPVGVVQVSAGGIVDGLRPGKAIVTATAPWGKNATAEVFVVKDLFVTSNRTGKFGIYQIRSMVADTLLPVLTDSFDNVQPSLSPDRTRIVFSSNRSGTYDLHLMDADGRNVRRLTTDPGSEGDPVWTPDGSRIVYTSTPKEGQPQLYALKLQGNPVQALTAPPGEHHSAAVSADGRTLAFVSTRDGNQEVYLMPLTGGATRRVTETRRRDSHPRFLPNGDLLYVSERPGSKGSRVIRLTGTGGEERTVLESEEPIAGIAVSRDGTRLAYVVGRVTDVAKGRARFNLLVQPLAAGSAPSTVALRPREHVLSPAF
jgi:WD40-like Beta Propeller Repeat/Bacterial Ig-like domain (group 2)